MLRGLASSCQSWKPRSSPSPKGEPGPGASQNRQVCGMWCPGRSPCRLLSGWASPLAAIAMCHVTEKGRAPRSRAGGWVRLAAPQLRAAMMLCGCLPRPCQAHLCPTRQSPGVPPSPPFPTLINLSISSYRKMTLGAVPLAMSKGKQGLEEGWCPLSLWGQGGTPMPPSAQKTCHARPVTWSPSSLSSRVTLTALAGSVSGPSFIAYLSPWAGGLVSLGDRDGDSATPPGRLCQAEMRTTAGQDKESSFGSTRSHSETQSPSPRP